MQPRAKSARPAATPDTIAAVFVGARRTASMFGLVVAAASIGGCSTATNRCTGPNPEQEATIPLTVGPDGGYVSGGDAGVPGGYLDDLVASCQASAGDCIPLCQSLVPGPWQFISCRLVTGDGGLAVQVDYIHVCLG